MADFHKTHGTPPGRTALFLGALDPAKGTDFLVRCVETTPGLTIALGGRARPSRHCAGRRRRGASIRVVGRLDGHEKAVALRAATVLGIPQAIGLVAVDSMAAGFRSSPQMFRSKGRKPAT